MSDALPSAEPFFLIGAERSGTTLMSLMLDHHPQIHSPFESNYLVDYLTADGEDPDPAVLQQQLALDRIARADGFQVQPGQGYKEAARAFLAGCAETSGKPIFGAAIHRRFPDILHLWPQARFLNLVRDPRDVASSVIAMGWAGTFWHGSRAWVQAQEEAQELFKRIPAERWLTLRFEDLVCEPVTTLTRVCEFLGCSFDQAMLSYPQHSNYPPPDASVAWRWKRKLTARQIQLVEASAGDWLQLANYEHSGQPRTRIGSMERLWLKIRNRCGKLDFQVDRYGFFTVLAFALSSRLGMNGVVGRLLLKMQARDHELLR